MDLSFVLCNKKNRIFCALALRTMRSICKIQAKKKTRTRNISKKNVASIWQHIYIANNNTELLLYLSINTNLGQQRQYANSILAKKFISIGIFLVRIFYFSSYPVLFVLPFLMFAFSFFVHRHRCQSIIVYLFLYRTTYYLSIIYGFGVNFIEFASIVVVMIWKMT